MAFRILGLSSARFAPLFGLEDQALAERNVQRVLVEAPRSAPCRITLEDALPGERVLLLSYEHMSASSPFRACGPIFVRETTADAYDHVGRIPDALARRTLSARGYDRKGMMIKGQLVEGTALEGLVEDWLGDVDVETVHLHYASRGCYAAKAERAYSLPAHRAGARSLSDPAQPRPSEA